MVTRILLVEDDELIAELVRHELASEGYEVEIAETGAQGRVLAAASEFSLVILDLGLPDMSGNDLARHFRATGLETPILVLTSRDTSESVIEGLDAGADDYLTKPFEVEVLKARIRALLRRGPTPVSTRIIFGDVDVDRLKSEVRVAARPVRMTPKEYDLLCHLISHPNQILSRSDLLSAVWGIHFDPGSNLADVTITRLRSKLGPSKVEIASIRGRGYMLTLREGRTA